MGILLVSVTIFPQICLFLCFDKNSQFKFHWWIIKLTCSTNFQTAVCIPSLRLAYIPAWSRDAPMTAFLVVVMWKYKMLLPITLFDSIDLIVTKILCWQGQGVSELLSLDQLSCRQVITTVLCAFFLLTSVQYSLTFARKSATSPRGETEVNLGQKTSSEKIFPLPKKMIIAD